MQTPTQETLQKYVDAGLINEQSHPEHPHIKIYNYTPECQFSKAWDDVTILCRGLIIDTTTHTVLARPFKKFFNYDEHISMGGNIPDEIPLITEKLDGSLGILYFLGDEPWIATRGSFSSDQAKWATAQIRKKDTSMLDRDYTYLFEIIYPENRIVVSYDYADIVLLAAINTATGAEVWFTDNHPVHDHFRVRQSYNYVFDVPSLKALDTPNSEGFVLHYVNAGLRLKIKFDTYVKLHKTLTGLSEIGVWELLKEKGITTPVRQLVGDMPDEFYGWLTEDSDRLYMEYSDIQSKALAVCNNVEHLQSRKEQAAIIMSSDCVPSVVFAMLNGKDWTQIIYKLIRPSGKKTFTQDKEV